ncbi:MAG: hypothetical protein M3198_15755, partial [Actinomycetota bacterium]|nr:hypothetical protein [Actinomycetota bacterium]
MFTGLFRSWGGKLIAVIVLVLGTVAGLTLGATLPGFGDEKGMSSKTAGRVVAGPGPLGVPLAFPDLPWNELPRQQLVLSNAGQAVDSA